MTIRQAVEKDYPEIYELVKTAFKTARVSDGTEQDFVLELRAGSRFLPGLEFVAEEDGRLIGHVLLTRQTVQTTAGDIIGVLVAPLCVALEYRDRGVGGQLMRTACRQAVRAGYTAAFLVGNPAYYGRFGFRPTADFGIRNLSDIPDEVVLGCELEPGALRDVEGSLRIL